MAGEPMAPVVVGLDGSPSSLHALDLAAEEALGRVTPLEVLCVRERVIGPPGTLPGVRTLLAAATRRICEKHPGLAVRTTFASGDPVEVLLRHAADGCLVVLGHAGTPWRPVGDVAARVAARCTVPLILCRPFDRARASRYPRSSPAQT